MLGKYIINRKIYIQLNQLLGLCQEHKNIVQSHHRHGEFVVIAIYWHGK